jgi:hypothetical protein
MNDPAILTRTWLIKIIEINRSPRMPVLFSKRIASRIISYYSAWKVGKTRNRDLFKH